MKEVTKGETKRCLECGGRVPVVAHYCIHCGGDLWQQRREAERDDFPNDADEPSSASARRH